ncbi:glycosyltransferase family 4 protein [Ruminococcus sp.]
MKKVCFITTISGTITSFILDFAKYMYEKGDYDITFICNKDEKFAEDLPTYIHYIPVEMERGISFRGIFACAEMWKIFRKNKFDLIQYSTPNASLYASIAGSLAGVPVRLYCQWGLAYVGFSGVKRKIFKCEEKLVCKLSTWIEPDSRGNLSFCHEEKLYPEKKGSVVHKGSASGVSLEKFDISKKKLYRSEIREQYKIPEKAFVYGFVGRITGDKGINELLASTKNILKSHKDIYVLMVGGVEKETSVNTKLYEWSKENSHVIYCGSTKEVQKYMSAMDCYVMPSYREGFGLTVVEAGSMGIPVICTNIPGPTDAIHNEETGLVIEKKNEKELRDAILRIYDDSQFAKKLGQAGYENVKENYEQKNLFKYILHDREGLLRKARRRTGKR